MRQGVIYEDDTFGPDDDESENICKKPTLKRPAKVAKKPAASRKLIYSSTYHSVLKLQKPMLGEVEAKKRARASAKQAVLDLGL